MLTRGEADAVDRLWGWLREHASELRGEPSDALVMELDRLVADVGDVDWELGPDGDHGQMFSLSPRGRREWLERCEQLVARAPAIPGWRFAPAKPPREWRMRFAMKTSKGPVEVDGTEWEVVGFRLPSGLVDLDFRPPPSADLAADDAWAAAAILVDGELGERLRLECVNELDVVRTWGERAARAARRLTPGLLHDLVTRSRYRDNHPR